MNVYRKLESCHYKCSKTSGHVAECPICGYVFVSSQYHTLPIHECPGMAREQATP